jgi:uncharacterized protein YndB with AHSA1/START domain
MNPMPQGKTAVRMERIIPTPPQEVYRAWLDPDLVRRWMAPGFDVGKVEIEERVGGGYRVWHMASGIPMGGFDCEILELVENQRLVFRWGFVGPERKDGPVFDSLLTITLRDSPGNATVLTLLHERLDQLAVGMPDAADKVEMGWSMVLEKLKVLLGKEQEDDFA